MTDDNLIEYKEGVLPEDNTNTDSDGAFTFGKGDSYGIELLLKKNKAKITGWIGYTLSKTTRFFNDVNEGVAFPAKYDRIKDWVMDPKGYFLIKIDKELNQIRVGYCKFSKSAKDKLPKYGLPSLLKVLDALPKGVGGTVNKKELVQEAFPIQTIH